VCVCVLYLYIYICKHTYICLSSIEVTVVSYRCVRACVYVRVCVRACLKGGGGSRQVRACLWVWVWVFVHMYTHLTAAPLNPKPQALKPKP
jgi:hypothetical protein